MSFSQQIELIMSRTDQDALNRFSLVMVETVVKRLEYQINHNQIAHCKAWLHTFIIFAKQSKRFGIVLKGKIAIIFGYFSVTNRFKNFVSIFNSKTSEKQLILGLYA
jgi:hypothetical protein